MISATKQVLLTMLLLSCVSFAQQGASSIQGQVVDQLGGVIIDATIKVTRADFQATSRTDRQGAFVFSALTPGRYEIRVTAEGFTPFENNAVFVYNETRILSIQLQVSRQTQAVTVTSDPLVSPDLINSATTLVLRGATLDGLPDNPQNLAAALQVLARAGNPQGPQFIVDGFSNSRLPPKKSIREIRINQNAFSAQYDRPGVGRVEILTKPGSDTLNGGLYTNFTDDWMNSRNPFAPERSQFKSRLYGANLSGPLVPRHASFFLNLERLENEDNAVINASVLDDSLNVIPFNRQVLTPQWHTHADPRIDLRINNSHTLVSRYSYKRADFSQSGIRHVQNR